jgi:hypothetical protein
VPAEQAIAFSDAGRSRRLMWSPDGGYRLLHENTNVALGTKLDAEGRFVQAEWVSGTITRIEADGTRTVLAATDQSAMARPPGRLFTLSLAWKASRAAAATGSAMGRIKAAAAAPSMCRRVTAGVQSVTMFLQWGVEERDRASSKLID